MEFKIQNYWADAQGLSSIREFKEFREFKGIHCCVIAKLTKFSIQNLILNFEL